MAALVAAAPSDQYDAREHIDYCFTCIAKTLPLEQQLVLLLKQVYGFTVAEVCAILSLGEGKVKHALADGRSTMSEIFDRRCALINREGVCYECSEINGFVNPRHEIQQRMMQIEMTSEAARGATHERLLDLRLQLVRSIDPLSSPMAPLHDYLLELMDDEARTREGA